MVVYSGMFAPVNSTRVSAEVVGQIERAIENGDLEIGDRLPSERELTERFEVSRSSVRDAFRVLEAHGLIEVKLGARGGAFVTAPEPSRIGGTLARMLMLAAVGPDELEEARHVFELAVLELACERADATDVAALRSICDETETAIAEGRFHSRYSVAFHVRLAESAHNAALTLLFDSFQNAVLLTLLRAREGSPEHGLRGLGEHRAMVEAIESRDLPAARRLMEQHLQRTAAALKAARALAGDVPTTES
jgi:GntR family transcriptional regulator, transcriptional repressor for pyruvate dehydrogenase complex